VHIVQPNWDLRRLLAVIHALGILPARRFVHKQPGGIRATFVPAAFRRLEGRDGNGPANPGLEQTYGFHIFDLDLRTRYRQFCGLGPGSVVLRIDGLPAENLVSEFAE